jgi:hypothetical protein
MPTAINHRHGIQLATINGADSIPEMGAVTTALDVMHDVHFGVNNSAFDVVVDQLIPLQKDLLGLGPRILDICNRGGRTAEDTWRILGRGHRPATYVGARGQSPGFQGYFDTFNQEKSVSNEMFKPGSTISGTDVGGQRKYAAGATAKDQTAAGGYGGFQYGTRWSKTALEYALSNGQGVVHFHLDGMGNINDIVNKAGNFSHNVTSRELRYIFRNWGRFKNKVVFYNGYDAADHVVKVVEPWLWRDDSTALRCTECNKEFGFFTRKHHCRACGKIYCADCTSQEKILLRPARRPGVGGKVEVGAVRVCDDCF